MGFFKISQGVWAGENYAGGRIITPNDDSDGKLFARLWQTVKPVSFLDRIAHNHDLGYEYAERAYGDKGVQPKNQRGQARYFSAVVRNKRSALRRMPSFSIPTMHALIAQIQNH